MTVGDLKSTGFVTTGIVNRQAVVVLDSAGDVALCLSPKEARRVAAELMVAAHNIEYPEPPRLKRRPDATEHLAGYDG